MRFCAARLKGQCTEIALLILSSYTGNIIGQDHIHSARALNIILILNDFYISTVNNIERTLKVVRGH